MSYYSRRLIVGCLINLVLLDLIRTSLAIVVGDRKGRCGSLSLDRTMSGDMESSEVGHSKSKTFGFLGRPSKFLEVNMICSISQTVNTKCPEGGYVHALFLNLKEHLDFSSPLLLRRLFPSIIHVQRNPESQSRHRSKPFIHKEII
jgi:hypothetical protein